MSKSSSTKRDTKEEGTEDTGLSLNFLTKFIKPFDGSREKLNAFVTNCNNAVSLASPAHEELLVKYILSQMEGKAETACAIKEFPSWGSLREFLRQQFGEKKHSAHLLSELQECKQTNNESVHQYALKVESCLSQLLTDINSSNFKKEELPGRIAGMEDLALHTFVIGLVPRISNIVRCRDPTTLNQAINIAASEEKVQQIIYKQNKPINTRPTQQRPNNVPNYDNRPSLFCRYCKKPGHVLERCRVRERNNQRYNNTAQPFSPGQSNLRTNPRFTSTTPAHRVSHVDEEPDNPAGLPDENSDSHEFVEQDLN